MIAFIIASYRGDIYAMTGNVRRYQSPMQIHTHTHKYTSAHTYAHAMNNYDVHSCQPYSMQATHYCADEESLITLTKSGLHYLPSFSTSIYFVLEKLIGKTDDNEVNSE